jgi:hypothetical protein
MAPPKYEAVFHFFSSDLVEVWSSSGGNIKQPTTKPPTVPKYPQPAPAIIGKIGFTGPYAVTLLMDEIGIATCPSMITSVSVDQTHKKYN